jgi:hypothetical protein
VTSNGSHVVVSFSSAAAIDRAHFPVLLPKVQ